MKNLVWAALLSCGTAMSVFAQTNTFPASGNVGVGTSTPSSKVQIHGSGAGTSALSIIENPSSSVGAHFTSEGANNIMLQLKRTSDGATNTQLRSDGTSFFNALNGNVGIGTTSPQDKLHVAGGYTGLGHFMLYAEEGYGNSGTAYLQARDRTGTTSLALRFRTQLNGNYVETMHLGANGNIGMGTMQPQAHLDLSRPDASMHITASNATGGGIGNPYLYINRISEGLKLEYVPNVLARISNTYMGPEGHIAFSTWGQDRMTIAGNGNIGIGTTTPANRVQIGANLPAFSGNDLVVSNEQGALAIHNDVSHTYLYGSGDIAIRPGHGKMAVYANSAGNVGIGTTTPGSYKLAVEGILGAREIVVTNDAWADFVFKPTYKLPSLTEVENYIKANGHLPAVPSEQEVAEKGNNLGQTDAILLQKIEELTLYMIEKDKQVSEQKQLLEKQQAQIEALTQLVKQLAEKK